MAAISTLVSEASVPAGAGGSPPIGATAAYTYAFRGTRMSLDDYLDSIETLPQLGLHWFDLEILREEHIAIYEDDANARQLEASLERHGVRVAGFTAWACLELIHSADPEDHARGFALFERMAAIGRRFSARYVHLGSDMIRQYIVERDPTYVTAPPTRIDLPSGVTLESVLDGYAERVGMLAAIAQDQGLQFALEPRANSLVNGTASFMDLVRRVGHANLYACLDVVHLRYHREDLALAIERVGPRLAVLQVCDALDGDLAHLPLGDGQVDLERVSRGLARSAATPFVMLELYRSGNDPKAAVDAWYADGYRRLQALLATREP
jgi:sugar phosphate isomerase/epimerase